MRRRGRSRSVAERTPASSARGRQAGVHGQGGVMFSHGASLEFELVGVVDELVEDGVGECGVAEQFMPLSQGDGMNRPGASR